MKLILAACAITSQANAAFGRTNSRVTSPSFVAKEQYDSFAQERPALLIRGGSSHKDVEANKSESNDGTSNSTKKKRRRRKQKNGNASNKTSTSANEEDNSNDTAADGGKSSTKIKQESGERKTSKAEMGSKDANTSAKHKTTSRPKPPPPPPPPPQDWEHTTSAGKNNTKQNPSNGDTVKPKPNPNDEIVNIILKAKDLYEILDIDKSKKATLTSTQITKAYRRRAVLTHPDKLNGDRRAFDKVSEAYDVLSDESKRKIYDRYGLEAVKDPDFAMNRGGSSFQDQIFKSFFGSSGAPGGSFSSRMANQFRKNSDLRYELEVSLEDMYKGVSHDIQISQPNGPKKVQVDIPAGIIPGSSIRLPGMVDHVPTAEPGDVVFMVRQRKHDTFTRKGYDLAMEVKISLSEAICGFQRQFAHLDGRKISIASPKAVGKKNTDSPVLIRSGDVHVLKGEGMPKEVSNGFSWEDSDDEHERSERFGDLYVQYVVEIPSSEKADNLTEEERKMLGILLDKMQGLEGRRDDSAVDSGTRRLRRALASDFGRASGTPTVDNDEDEHMPREEEHFSRNSFQYFSSTSGRAQHFFSRGGSPFSPFSGGMNSDDGDVQCQQM